LFTKLGSSEDPSLVNNVDELGLVYQGLTPALAGDWLTTRQHHSQSPSRRDENTVEATEEPYWEEEEDSTGRSSASLPDRLPSSVTATEYYITSHTSCKNYYNHP